MKIPKRPPPQMRFPSPEKFDLICEEGMKTENEGKYRHWDILRHLTPPPGLTLEEWWSGIQIKRRLGFKTVPLRDAQGKNFFVYNTPDKVLEQLHQIDLEMGGIIAIPEAILDPQTRDRYLVHSLIQEAITSSQIEGAATTRKVAKEMLRSGRSPRDKSEQMILNNFQTLQKIKTWKDLPLSKELILEIQQ